MFTLESPNTHLDIKWESYTSMTKWPVSQIGHNVQNKKKWSAQSWNENCSKIMGAFFICF